ncbi:MULTISPECIES: NUDIX domain-containing protein [unclassified Cytobacillus]|uniref:NUDIX domain-containing protein n=1 Tax=unclassified Cytobacillus TaxID=2675268 RepID=UPI001356D03A|nr:NUDIX domain-containing protein [Cytobacillus sp. AMY 15.2]KAF0819941.1 MutT-like protein [Bacillus sp. ZZV12-4809]MCM3093205.1 NUDIX domain-containing protein [Cytobacillus sp. AMY 15.2]
MTYHIRVRAGAVIIENNSILLIEFQDEKGLHFNLPAGGVEPQESVIDAVIREVKEEASVDVRVGPLAFVYEYAPHLNEFSYGQIHSLDLMFECQLIEGSMPKMPSAPDPNQTGVRWVPLSTLANIVLYPNMKAHILEYINNKRNIDLIEEHTLDVYPMEMKK